MLFAAVQNVVRNVISLMAICYSNTLVICNAKRRIVLSNPADHGGIFDLLVWIILRILPTTALSHTFM